MAVVDPRYSLTGLLVGFLVGLTGMGGGSLMTPVLIVLLGVKPTIAVGSDMVYSAITRAFGAREHLRAGFADMGLALRFAAGSVPASVAAIWMMRLVENRHAHLVQLLIERVLGWILIVIAMALLARTLGIVQPLGRRGLARKRARGWAWPICMGAAFGFLVGVTSVGAGTLFGIGMLIIFGMRARAMVATDIVHGAILSFAAAAAQVWARHVDYPLVANLLIGAVPGVIIGSRLSTRVPEKVIRPTVAVALLAIGLRIV